MLVPTPENWVWLKVLYASPRSWKRNRSFTVKFLNAEVFQLLTPGPRTAVAGMSPILATVGAGQPAVVHRLGDMATGSAKAATLYQVATDLWPLGRFGFATINGREPSPPPTKLTV